jgi:hypothetical protein
MNDYIYICIYIYIERERERESVSEGTTGRQERKREWWRVNNTEIPCICV